MKTKLVATLIASSFLLPTANAAEYEIEEVIVTAQKREQSLKDVPGSVTAIPADKIDDILSSGENIRALSARAPSLNVESSNGRQSPRFYIRGIGNYDFDVNATQPVLLILDEVSLENPVLKSLPMFDLQQVEVLAGPQGTLFGRGTTAGVVKIDTVKPSQENDGFVSAGFGSRDTYNLTGAIGGGLTDTVSARLSVNYLDRDDWIDNTVTGSDTGGFDELSYRLQFLFEQSDELSALIKLHGFHQDGEQAQAFYANAFTPGVEGLRSGFDEETVSHDGPSFFELDHFGASAKIEYDMGNNTTLTSITSYDTVDSFSQGDVDGGLQGGPEAIGVLGGQAFFSVNSGDGLSDHGQFTQEIRVSGERDNFFFQVGFYHLDEEITVDSSDFANGGAQLTLTQVEQRTESTALFGQIEYEVNDQFSVTVGGRFTDDEKDLEVIPGPGSTAPAATIGDDDDYFSWELAGNYDVDEDLSVYARVSTGSRGPVTLGRFGFTSQADTETITSFEAGFKATLWDGRARWNATAYTWDIDDQQLTATGGTGNTNEILNADTEGNGIETEFEMFITEHLRMTVNASYNDTEITDSLLTELCSATPLCTTQDPIVDTFPGFFGTVNLVSVKGNPLPRAPEWIYNIIFDYERSWNDGVVYASMDWNYRDESNIFLYESTEFVSEDRWLGGIKVGYRTNSGYDIAFVGRNITDEIVAEGALDFLNQTAFVNEPEYYGLEFRKSF